MPNGHSIISRQIAFNIIGKEAVHLLLGAVLGAELRSGHLDQLRLLTSVGINAHRSFIVHQGAGVDVIVHGWNLSVDIGFYKL